ncbi:hypothetical protein [Limimaricola cinnabarinus]|uniref:hypothetical protein n=1 Tax=Limimaricola cinnabarinus TaxID=1125964 RepID=UPI0005EC627A|nr:hypothetical protein [Limimaricola cinnabarinus]
MSRLSEDGAERLRASNKRRNRQEAVMTLASCTRAKRVQLLRQYGYSRDTANAATDVLELMINTLAYGRRAAPLSGKAEDDDRIE